MAEPLLQSPTQISDCDERIETIVRELELALRWDRPCILFAVYHSEYVRADVQSLLENQLMDLGQQIRHIYMTGAEGEDLLESLDEHESFDGLVFFVEGLRWGHTEQKSVYTLLNKEREFFRENGLRIIFWLTQNEIADLARLAPDFWAYRHYMLEFSESPSPQQVMQQALDSAWQGTGEYAGQYDDTDEKISLREALLTDMPSQEEAISIRANLLLTLGLLNWRKGDLEKADEQLHEALRFAAKMQDNWFEAECFNAVALVKTSLGRIDDAIDAYKQAINLAPDQIFAWNNLGNLCSKIGRNDEALVTFTKAIDCNPQDPIAWNGLGNVYSRIGYADDAVTAYRKSIQFMPSFAQPWNGLGEVYASVGRAEDAIKAFQKAVQLNKLYIAPWLRLAELYTRQERYRDAVRAYQRALQLDARSSSIWNELGVIYLKSNSLDEAEEALNKAIEIDRGNGLAHSNLGLLRSQQGRPAEAITLLLRSMELLKDNRDKAVTCNRLGDIYRQLNHYKDAVAAYQMADGFIQGTRPAAGSAVEPLVVDEPVQAQAAPQQQDAPAVQDEPAAGAELAPIDDSASAQDQGPKAEYLVSSPLAEPQVARIEPGLQDEQGATMAAQNVTEAALTAAEPAAETLVHSQPVEDDPEEKADAFAWNEKGNIHFQQGDYEHAIDAYNRAIEIDPALGWPYSNMALSFMAQGRYSEALLLYKKSLEMLTSDVDKAVSWNGLGNAYRAMGDYNNAVAAYQKAAELDPATAGMREGSETFHLSPEVQSAQEWNELGESFQKTGAYREARSAFQKAIELDPGFGWPYSNLARVMASQGRHADAIPLYLKSIELLKDKNDKAVSWNRLGNTYRKLNDYDNAIKAFQEAVALNDESMDLVTRTRFSLLSNCYAE